MINAIKQIVDILHFIITALYKKILLNLIFRNNTAKYHSSFFILETVAKNSIKSSLAFSNNINSTICGLRKFYGCSIIVLRQVIAEKVCCNINGYALSGRMLSSQFFSA